MSETERVRMIAASHRRGAGSERGCQIAVKYLIEGESGTHIDWLDDFLDEHCPGVRVGTDGLGRRLVTDGGRS